MPRSDLVVFRFIAVRDADGRLSLRHGPRTVPVNEDYLRHHLAVRQIELPPGGSIPIDRAMAKDLIEEALADVGQNLRSVEAHKRSLLAWFRTATETTASDRGRLSASA